MSLRLYMYVSAQDDGAERLSDPDLLDRADELGRVLFPQDDDLLVEAHGRQRRGRAFAGVIYSHQQNITVRRTLDDLELLAKACAAEDLVGRVEYLPLK